MSNPSPTLLVEKLRREGLCLLMRDAPMQYRHEIGHAPANLAFAADTKRKTSVPLFFASTGGLRLPSFMPILHLSLQFIDCYSPSLLRFSQVSGLDCPHYNPILHYSLHLLIFTVLHLPDFASIGPRLPTLQTYSPGQIHNIDLYPFIFS